jgi:hypothetical protein
VYIPRAVRALSAKWPLSICSVDQCGPSCWSVSVRIRSSDADHLGYAGRRVLVSRKWSGKTLADHRADRKEWLLRTLGISATDPARYTWEAVAPADHDHMDHARRMLHVVADRLRWQAALNEARRRASTPEDPDHSATGRVA